MENNKWILFISVVLLFLMIVSANLISNEEENYVNSLIDKQGVYNVSNITKLNKSFFPSQINIGSVEENQVGIYRIEYGDSEVKKEVFVLSYVADKISEISSKKVAIDNYFVFSSRNLIDSSFIGSYVMLKPGSITGLSSSIDLSGSGKVFIYIYKNGKLINFFNEIDSREINTIDFDLQSIGLNNFVVGDVLSLYVYLEGGGTVNEIDSVLKVTE